jgi:hypothetical protein
VGSNKYFNLYHQKQEQSLLNDLVEESVRIHSIQGIYIPRESSGNVDPLFREDILSKFNDYHHVDLYIKNVEAFEGDGDIFRKFGLDIKNQITFSISRKSFAKIFGREMSRPREGDLIYIPLTGSFHEIKFVEHESTFYQLGNIYTYQLQCETFEYSNEKFNTGVEIVDGIEDTYEYKQRVTIINTNNGPQFKREEKVTQLVGYNLSNQPIYMTGYVADVYYKVANSTTEMYLMINNLYRSDNAEGLFEISGPGAPGLVRKIIGQTSGAEWLITEVDDAKQLRNDPDADNITMETIADGILDFTESNPFGEP